MKEIKVLGTGCAKCKRLEKMVKTICEKHNISASIEKIEVIDKIIEFGVMSTPGLVVDGVVKAAGRVPKESEILGWLDSK